MDTFTTFTENGFEFSFAYEDLKHLALFDVLLSGAHGELSPRRGGRCYMYQLYPCGLMQIGLTTDSQEFDQKFAPGRAMIDGHSVQIRRQRV